jgi:prolyl-tRNA editing enzyme YbaK/EbsC (Cys-tRNA(Pro) deacylase)
VLATTRLDVNKVVRKRLGARKCSFATAEQTIAWSDGMQIGGVTVFGLPDDVPIWVDSRVAALDQIIVGGGSRSLKLLVPPAAILGLPNAEVVEGLARDAG